MNSKPTTLVIAAIGLISLVGGIAVALLSGGFPVELRTALSGYAPIVAWGGTALLFLFVALPALLRRIRQ